MDGTASDDGGTASFLEQEDLLDPSAHCNICRERFESVAATALLPCGHTVCRNCAAQELRDVQRLVCPVCQNSVPGAYGPADLDGLLPNVFAKTPPASGPPCSDCVQHCASADEAERATAKCTTCQAHFCSDHEQVHRRIFGKKRHTIERLAGTQGWQIDVCMQHYEPLKAFCTRCNTLVCLACIVDNHRSPQHAVNLLADDQKRLVGLLTQAHEEGQSCRKRLKATIEQVPAAVTAIENTHRSLTQHIRQSFAALHQALDARQSQLLAESDVVAAEDQAELEAELCHLKRRWLGLDGAAAVADRLLEPTARIEEVGWYSTATAAFLTAEAAKPIEPLPMMREPIFFLSEELLQAVQQAGKLSHGRAHAPNCIAEGAGLMSALTDSTKLSVSFSITCRDGRNEPVTKGGDVIEVQARAANNDEALQLKKRVVDHGNGKYTVAYSASDAGQIRLSVLINGLPVRGSPFTVHVAEGRLFHPEGECLYDNAGILYHLGTMAGRHAWLNPHEAEAVTVTASSVNFGHVSVFVANQAGRFQTNDVAVSWVMVDLKERRVLPTAYVLSLFNGFSGHYPRHWVLESSTDCIQWHVLKTHKDDRTLHITVPTGRWSLDVSADAIEPARYLRIRQTGPNSSGHHFFLCSGFEVYGWLM